MAARLGYGKMSPDLKKAMRRLEKDQQELIKSPVTNVSAAPLDTNMLEWHCNIQHNDNIYHLILFFPKEYPCVSPSAEFVPTGFNYQGGATMPGQKGTKICLSIFSDFADIHTEWENDTNTGWSPGYTVQTVLLNVVSFLSEIQRCYGQRDPYHTMCRKFVCNDCGHKMSKPFPPLNKELPGLTTDAPLSSKPHEDRADSNLHDLTSKVIDYMSKEKFSLAKPTSQEDLFGYGLSLSGNPKHPQLTSPCEFLTAASFKDMISSLGEAQSVHREKLRFFLPLYISDEHGSMIRKKFEETMQKISHVLPPDSSHLNSFTNVILRVIPNLMCSTVIQFSKGTVHASDNSLEGYFALHRLFLWAIDTYPGLIKEVNKRIEDFVTKPDSRNKTACPDIGQWLMLLSVTGRYSWENVAEAYLAENFKRNVMWYLKSDKKLSFMDIPMDYRLQQTFELTKVGRNLLAFQVIFLKIAKPSGMSRQDVLKRYSDNLGFPTQNMVQELKNAFNKIYNDVTRYDHWYRVIGVSVPSRAELNETLKESVRLANSTTGYFFTNNGSRKYEIHI